MPINYRAGMMNLPLVLNVAIGLILIFLIFSLLASEIQELLTTVLQWRASHLKDSITVLLAGGVETQDEEKIQDIVNKLYSDPLIKNINQEARGLAGKIRIITRWLIPGNQRGGFFGADRTTGPSYIASDTFASSLLEQIGLATLSQKLIEVRLQKFAIRIIGIYDIREEQSEDGSKEKVIAIPPNQDPRLKDLWKRGRIRLIAERVKYCDLDQDRNFQTLVEEFDDILHNFKAGEINLVTSVERMGESFSTYIANDPVTESSEGNNADFVKRLAAFKQGVFGEKSERAVASGGLRPSLLEIAELVNQSSSVYGEVAEAYQELVREGNELDTEVLPRLKDELLKTQIEVVEQQLFANYLDQIEQQLRERHPNKVQPFKKKLDALKSQGQLGQFEASQPVRRRRGLGRRIRTGLTHQWQRRNGSTPKALKRQQQQIIAGIFDRLSDRDQNELTKEVLNHLNHRELYGDVAKGDFGFIDHVFDQLAHEEQQRLLGKVLSDLSQEQGWNAETEKKKRSLYKNYQSYKNTQQILAKLPNSVKESFTILARRAQVRVQQTGNDIHQFQKEVAAWFDRSMSRASGVYKRNAKGVAILIGLFLVVVTNVDAGFIVDRLSNDENLRNVVATRAISLTDAKTLDEARVQANEALKELAVPIGWNPANVTDQLDCKLPEGAASLPANWSEFYSVCITNRLKSSQTTNQVHQATPNSWQSFLPVAIALNYPLALIRILLGWLIAGIAIAMGAPFWFDLLGKVVNVRNSGSKPPAVENQSVTNTNPASME